MKDRNENRPGYKKTKVGWIPDEWDYDFVKSTGSVLTGTTPSTLHPEYYEGKHPFVTPVDLGFSPWIKNSVSTLTDGGLKKARKVCKGAVLFVCIGSTIGKVGIANVELATNQQINTIIPNSNNMGAYLYYALLYQSRRIASYAGCQAVPIINKSQFESVRLPLPPLPEQKKIAEILSTWDEAIDQTRKLIDAKKRRKKALMQQLLTGKKRLPGFTKSIGRKPYRFFDLPQDWECLQIKDIAKECSERNTEGHNLTVLACSKHLGFVESSEYFGKRIFSADTSNYKVIRRGYFGYPSNHIEEGSIGLLLTHDIGIVSPIYTVFKCVDSVIQEYLYAVFKTDTFRHIFAISTNASVDRRGSLRWKEFSFIRIPQPSIEEQQAIVEVLHIADNEIAQLETKLKALEKQKHGLMQKLLTGEIRVKT